MGEKLRVACLHGYGTNAKFLKRQMRSFMRAMDRQLQFVFIDAPFFAPRQFILDQKVLELIEGQPRSWIPLLTYKQRTRDFTEHVIKSLNDLFEDAEYDGLLGFSQGCAMIHFILTMNLMGLIKWKWLDNIKFCFLVCGMTWNWQDIEKIVGQPLDIPSIHLISQADFIYQKSLMGTSQFIAPLVIQHQFGHVFPRIGRLQAKLMTQYIRKARHEKRVKQIPLYMSSL